MSSTLEIFELEDMGYAAYFPIPPFDTAIFIAPKKKPLLDLNLIWNELWPEVLQSMKSFAKDYEVDFEIKSDEFMGTIDYLEKGTYMSDKAKTFLSISIHDDAVPRYDFFLSELEIVHSQPVF